MDQLLSFFGKICLAVKRNENNKIKCGRMGHGDEVLRFYKNCAIAIFTQQTRVQAYSTILRGTYRPARRLIALGIKIPVGPC